MSYDAATDAPLPELAPHVLQDIYAHARETYPEECCGLLLGADDSTVIDTVRRCVNEQNRYHELDPERFPRTAREAYFLGGKDLRFLMESIRSAHPVKVIYHSHPDVGAYSSNAPHLRHLHFALWRGEWQDFAVNPAPLMASWEVLAAPVRARALA
jgi:proteasome lid subunit RPN8/RPN11